MNVLLVILSKTNNNDSFNEIIDNFETKGYKIHIFTDEKNELETTSLPVLIDYLCSMEKKDCFNRIVVLSDIRKLVFSWYRCYNSIADDFIYYIGEDNQYNKISTMADIFYEELYRFNGIENETVQGKIYLNLSYDNFHHISLFLLFNNRFRFFNDLSFFDYKNKLDKKVIAKQYLHNGRIYSFLPQIKQSNKTETIGLNSSTGETLKLNQDLINLLNENYYFIFYCIVDLYDMDIDVNQKIKFICILYDSISDDSIKKNIYHHFIGYIEREQLNFSEKMFYLTLLARLRLKNGLLEKIMDALIQDNNYIKYHYPLLMSSLEYHYKDGLELYNNVFQERETELLKITKYYESSLYIRPVAKRGSKKVAILTNQLLTILHSPTLCILNYAKNLKKYYPDYILKIFVDDAFVFSPSEIIPAHLYGSLPSSHYKEVHHKYLQGTGITIHYSNIELERKERLQEDLDRINEFNPELIFATGADFSILGPILYRDYPILDMSQGALSNCSFGDIYISTHDENYLSQEYKKYNYAKDRKVYKHTGGVQFPEPYKDIKRSQYGIAAEDFVMVTVGTRLVADLTVEFMDMVCSFLKQKPNTKWIIVGEAEIPYLQKFLKELTTNQLIFIGFEEDLAALYRICDVFINPFRRHGGFSAAMAMNQSLPVVALRGLSDVIAFVGEQNSAATVEEYRDELSRLYQDKEYRELRGKLMKQRILEEFNFKNTIDEIVKFFGMTIENFNKRAKQVYHTQKL
ncbi:MAG: glycosyltransferase family 4 protein [Bacillota bacterium]